MSSCLHETNQSNHDSTDYNLPNPEIVFDDDTADEEGCLDEDRMLFLKNLKPDGNSFALVLKSNGDPTYLLFEGFSDSEDCNSNSRRTRSSTRNIQASDSLSHDVSPAALAIKGKNDHNINSADSKRVASNRRKQSVRSKRNNKSSAIRKLGGDGHSGKVDKMARGFEKKQKNDEENGANNGIEGLNPRSYNLRPKRIQKYSVVKILGDDGRSDKADRVVRGLARKHSRGLVNRDRSGKVDKRRAGRLRRGLAKRRKNNQGKVAEKESICIIESRGGQGDGAERASSSCLVEAQGGQGNGAVKERRVCIIETQCDHGYGTEGKTSCKVEALDDQDYGDTNRAYSIWLRDYNAKICDLENGNVETSSDSDELEVIDKDPQSGDWKYTLLTDSNALDTSMEDDDIQYIGECSIPENPQFRKDVEDILGRPYDEEYKTLWLQVNSRKPMQGYRELRGHLKAYSKDAMGKSYLDEYLDLHKVLDSFQTDLPRKLNVLRGFFIYLKNVATEGIFKPWLDDSCLAIVPRTE